jgi:hypothetical protein
MLALALQIFFGKEHLVKKSVDLHPRQGNIDSSKEQFFKGLQHLSSLHKQGGDQVKNFSLFQTHNT